MTDFERGFHQGRAAVLIDEEPMKSCVGEILEIARTQLRRDDDFRDQAEGVFCLYVATAIAKHMIPTGTCDPIESTEAAS